MEIIRAPILSIVPHADDEQLIAHTRALIADPPDAVVATTGVGFRGWMEAADAAGCAEELLSVLRGARIIARGPKAQGAVHGAGLTADWVADSETAAEIKELFEAEGVAGLHVAVQHHGAGSDGIDELLVELGARVTSLVVYRWGPSPDPEAVSRAVGMVAAAEVDAVAFTSAHGVVEFLAACEREGLRDAAIAAMAGPVLPATVGPVTAAPLIELGLASIPGFFDSGQREGYVIAGLVLLTWRSWPFCQAAPTTRTPPRLRLPGCVTVWGIARSCAPCRGGVTGWR